MVNWLVHKIGSKKIRSKIFQGFIKRMRMNDKQVLCCELSKIPKLFQESDWIVKKNKAIAKGKKDLERK